MDTPIKRGFEKLGGENFDEKEPRKQKEIIKQKLEYDKFTPNQFPPSPCTTQHTFDNPAITQYCDELDWDEGWVPVHNTDPLLAYPEYVPTDEAIETIKRYGPILEVGAGAGYWAYMLSNAGCDITLTDMFPRDVTTPEKEFWKRIGTGENNFIDLPRTGVKSVDNSEIREDIPEDKYPNIPWADVKIADHSVVKTSKKTIFNCHPPCEEWTEEMLEWIDVGQTFIFVGEWFPGHNATPLFFHTLKEWELLETFPVYQYQSTNASGYVFKKQ